jgi:hypothetical protein
MLGPMSDAEIHVEPLGDGEALTFDVTVTERGSRTRHQVTMDRATAGRLGIADDPAGGIAAAFRFLLDRESKESIMGRFDVTVIARYFPEFEATLPDYLGHR